MNLHIKTIIIIVSYFIFLILIYVYIPKIYNYIYNMRYDIKSKDISIGNKYLFCLDFYSQDKDPFKIQKRQIIDTIEILDIKDGYVKYFFINYDYEYTMSNKLEHLQSWIKKIE